MADVNIKEVEGGEVAVINDDDGIELDTGAQSVWVKWSTIKSLIRTYLGSATELVTGLIELATNAEALAGTDTARAVTPANLEYARSVSGWIPVTGTWTYATANTITVPSGATALYQKGWGVRWKQGGAFKYAYITVVASTLLTITGGSDYTVANSAITDVAVTPTPFTAIGFPVTFACAAPAWDTSTIDNGTGGVQPTAGSQYFSIQGNLVALGVVLTSSGAVKNGGTNLITFSIPATLPAFSEPTLIPLGTAYTVDDSVGVGGVALGNGSGGIDLRYWATIANDSLVPFTGAKLVYKY